MATRKQKKVLELMVENGGLSTRKAMLAAGYSQAMANNPAKLLESAGFNEEAEKALPQKDLLKVARHGLRAYKKSPRIIGRDSKGNPEYEYVNDVDFYARHLYLQTALKIRGLAQTADTPLGDINIQIVNYKDTPIDKPVIDV